MVKKMVEREPRWPAFVAMVAAGFVYLALPEPFTVGPSWLLLAVVAVLMVPLLVSYHRGHVDVTRILTFTANGAITLGMVVSLAVLIVGIPQHKYAPTTLLRSAGALWVTNVLVFALWYWKLDAGGPIVRDKGERLASSFLFPQMMAAGGGDASWTPQFMDYLFLSFNT